jgi:tetratricopeptide (TPR) repeat protein
MKSSFPVVLAVFLCIFIFNAIPHVNAQHIHPSALEHFRRSLEYLLIGDYHNAIISSNNVIRMDPNSAINYVIRARAFYEINDYERAIADSSHAIRLDRNNAAAFNIRGNAHGQNGDINRAIADWEAALRINPNIDEARHNIELARQLRSN